VLQLQVKAFASPQFSYRLRVPEKTKEEKNSLCWFILAAASFPGTAS
jgi:hypothetical protein